MGKSADQISQEIDANRADAGAKIDQLQGQIQGNVEHTRDQVMETAEHVRDQAQGMVDDAVASVQNFDWHQQIDKQPLLTAGAALLGGFVLGRMLGGDGDQHRSSSYRSSGETSGGGHQVGGIAGGIRGAAEKSGLDDTISNAGAAIMGSVTEQLKTMLDQTFPGFADKLDSAQQKPGSFTDKAKATQQEAQRS